MKKHVLTVMAILLVVVGCKKEDEGGKVPVEVDYANIVAPNPHEFSIAALTVTGDAYPETKVESIRIERLSKNCLKTTFAFKVGFPSSTESKYKMIKLDSIPLTQVGDSYKIQTITQEVVSSETDPDPGVLTLDGEFVGKKLYLRMNIKSAAHNVTYNCVFEGKNTAAEITSFKVNHPSIIGNSEFFKGSQNDFIMCYVAEKDLNSKIKIVPEMVVPRGATITMNGADYTIGQEIELNISGTEFLITSENGKSEKKYLVKLNNKTFDPFTTNLDIWQVMNPGEEEHIRYSEPFGGWSSSNTGLVFIKSFGLYPMESPYVVEKVVNGDGYAAKLITADTKGASFGIPKITSGSLFNGAFVLDFTSPLKSTKFGTACTKKPVSLQGKYKYKAGAVYFRCPDPSQKDQAVEDNTITDLPAISAVLYEVSDDKETLDGTNLLTSEKIVAKACVTDFKTMDSFSDFNVNFVFASGKTFDATKKYKLAIVCSSSKDGDKFSGAPGSTLIVDDIKINF